MNMKCLFVCFLLLNVSSVFAQRTLQEYINLAKANSPLIHDNLAQQAVNKTEVLRLKAFYTKAQIGVTASYLFSPIISRDGSSPSFQANPESATNYSGYDLAYSNGGTYQSSRVSDTSYQELIPSDLALNSNPRTSHFLEKYKLDSTNLIDPKYSCQNNPKSLFTRNMIVKVNLKKGDLEEKQLYLERRLLAMK